MLLRTCLALFVVAGAWAQQTPPAKPPQKRDAPLTRSSFSAKGLHHEDDLTDFFVGNFADVPFDRGSLRLQCPVRAVHGGVRASLRSPTCPPTRWR